jgi:hypothetical protein
MLAVLTYLQPGVAGLTHLELQGQRLKVETLILLGARLLVAALGAAAHLQMISAKGFMGRQYINLPQQLTTLAIL